MTHDAIIEIIQAHKEGKKILRYVDEEDEGQVLESDNCSWNFDCFYYDIIEDPLPQSQKRKFSIGDKVKANGCSPVGEVVRYEGDYIVVDWGAGECGYHETMLELYEKPKPLTREEITAQWVKDNDVKIGDNVRYLAGEIGEVTKINDKNLVVHFGGLTNCLLNVEYLKKVTKRLEKFTFEDRELFRDKWVRPKGATNEEYKLGVIANWGVAESIGDQSPSFTYEKALKELEFIDGTPFGKEVWE